MPKRNFEIVTSFFKSTASLLIFLHIQLVHAAPVQTQPIVTYTLYGSSLSFSSLGELTANVNQSSKAAYDQCMGNAGISYSCSYYTIVGNEPSPAYEPNRVNGLPIMYSLPREFTNTSGSDIYPQSTTTAESGAIGAAVSWNCPSGFSAQSSGPSTNRAVTCTKLEPDAEPCTGNPINIGTGQKLEYAEDYSSADGVLKVVRRYVSQNAGWVIDSPVRLAEIPAGGSASTADLFGVSAVCPDSIFTQRLAYSTQPETALSQVPYVSKSCSEIQNPESTVIVFVWLDGKRYRFRESGNQFILDGDNGKGLALTRVDPLSNDQSVWKLVSGSGDEYLVSSEGLLNKIRFQAGGSLAFSYEGNNAISKTDHLGRTIQYTYDIHNRLAGFIQPDGSSVVYEYGADPSSVEFYLLKKVVWASGESITYLYNEPAHIQGNQPDKLYLTGKLDGFGRRIGTYKYSSGQAISTEGANGVNKRTLQPYWNFTYLTNSLNTTYTHFFNTVLSDGTRLVTRESQPAGSGCAASNSNVEYYSSGLPKSKSNFKGNKTQYDYNTAGLEVVRVEGVSSSDGSSYLPQGTALPAGVRKIATEWHGDLRLEKATASPRLLTKRVYNGDVDPFTGAVANCSPASRPLLCHVIRQATQDANGRLGLSAEVDPSTPPRHEWYTYNERGQTLTYSQSPNGNPEFTYEYYETTESGWTIGDLKSVTNALGHKAEFYSYDKNGRPLTGLSEQGVSFSNQYDARGRLLFSNVAGRISAFEYNVLGQLEKYVRPDTSYIRFEYDVAGRVVREADNVGNQKVVVYDTENKITRIELRDSVDALRFAEDRQYDALGRLYKAIGQNGQVTTNQFDAEDNPTSSSDVLGNGTIQTFDALNRLSTVTDALNGVVTYTYNAQDEITSVTDARGNVTSYTYDGLGNLLAMTSPDTGTTTYEYDAAGNKTKQTDARGVVTLYTYDALNRLTGVSYPATPADNASFTYDSTANGNRGVGRLTGYSNDEGATVLVYDDWGNLIQQTDNIGTRIYTTEYAYDTAGRITQITYPSQRIVYYTRDATGQITAIETRDTAASPLVTVVSAASYEPFGPLKSLTYGDGSTTTIAYDTDYRVQRITAGTIPIWDFAYTYDNADNIVAQTDQASTYHRDFSYDALYRVITDENPSGDWSYQYDQNGNRTQRTWVNPGSPTTIQNLTYPAISNRLTQVASTSQTRDAAGNLTAYGNKTYLYNDANRLQLYKVNGQNRAFMLYNAMGQRIGKTNILNPLHQHYDQSGHYLGTTSYNGNGTLYQRYDWIYLGDRPVAQIRTDHGTSNNVTSRRLLTIHTDHLDTPRAMADSNRNIVWRWDGNAFGQVGPNEDPDGNGTNDILVLRFPGQFYDSETGLYYNYYRDYDPEVGRYIQSDPIGLDGGMNTYGYSYQNPVMNIDPDGRLAFLAAIPFLGGSSGLGAAGSALLGGTALAVIGHNIYSMAKGDADTQEPTKDVDESDCEKDCALKAHAQMLICDMTAGVDYGKKSKAYKTCADRVNTAYVECMQDCAEEENCK